MTFPRLTVDFVPFCIFVFRKTLSLLPLSFYVLTLFHKAAVLSHPIQI